MKFNVRPVPRNIDRPNRAAEFLMIFLITYYGLMYVTQHETLVAFICACTAVYIMYKFTLNKPEGMMYRFMYKKFKMGRMVPSATRTKKFEV